MCRPSMTKGVVNKMLTKKLSSFTINKPDSLGFYCVNIEHFHYK